MQLIRTKHVLILGVISFLFFVGGVGLGWGVISGAWRNRALFPSTGHISPPEG